MGLWAVGASWIAITVAYPSCGRSDTMPPFLRDFEGRGRMGFLHREGSDGHRGKPDRWPPCRASYSVLVRPFA
jgi:hypothetical protein